MRYERRLGWTLALCMGLSARAATGVGASIAPGEPLTLERAIEIALAQHPARLAAEAHARAGEEREGAASAALLPQVYGAAQYLRATDNGIGSTSYLSLPGFPRFPSTGRNTNQLTETFDNYAAGVTAYQHLYDFGHTRGLIEQRDAEADRDRARARAVALDLVFRVARAYHELTAAKELVTVYQSAVVARTEQVRAAQAKSKAGIRPAIDLFTAQAALARAQLELVDARNGAAVGKAALDDAMGLGESAPGYELGDPLSYGPVTGTLDEYLAKAFRERPDLKMLQDEARAAGAQISEARSDYFPTIGAVAGFDTRGQDADPANNVHAGVLLTWPLFNGFRTDHEVAEAQYRQREAEHAINGLRQQIVLQVKRSFLDWQASLDRIHQAEQTVEASSVELELASKRYDAGLGSIIELTDAQRRYTEDIARAVRARVEYAVSHAALDRDTGCCMP